jgi:hyaluronoglucosaminidase
MYALAPGLSYDARDPRDFDLLAAKVRAVAASGARGIALLFDDLTADSTTLEPGAQADLVARAADLVASIDPGITFWFIGNFYCGDVNELRSASGFWSALYGRSAMDYFAAYTARVPDSVPIMWTGPAVFSGEITERDAVEFRDLVRRPVVLWDNFPVNDTLPGQIFLGPYLGREPGAVAAMHGVVLNLMSQAVANRISLATAADFFADMKRYDPDLALSRAVAAVAPGEEAAVQLGTFVEHHRGHPVLAAAATAGELRARTAGAFGGTAVDRAALAALREHLAVLAGNEAQLQRALGVHELLDEVAPWSRQLTRLASAAIAGVDAVAGLASVDAYAAAREAARGHDEIVAATPLPPALAPFVAGGGEAVDRFATLFGAIEQRLGRSAP